VEKGQKVKVTEGRIQWMGTYLWSESGIGNDVWAVIEPEQYTVHARRGSGNREYSENLIRIPLFLDKVEPVEA
jgi:hypothetical protein